MSGGMVPLPVLPVRAHFHNSSCLPLKPFTCHISGKSPQSSTSSDAATTRLDIVLGRANPFALKSFADPHPLNPVVSILYKIIGGRVVASPFQSFKPFQLSEFA